MLGIPRAWYHRADEPVILAQLLALGYPNIRVKSKDKEVRGNWRWRFEK